MPFVRNATAEDVEYLAPRLRQADVVELKVGSGSTSYDALMEGLRVSSTCSVGCTDDGRPFIMGGVAECEPGLSGSVWMLSSDTIYKHKFTFFRVSKQMLDG